MMHIALSAALFEIEQLRAERDAAQKRVQDCKADHGFGTGNTLPEALAALRASGGGGGE